MQQVYMLNLSSAESLNAGYERGCVASLRLLKEKLPTLILLHPRLRVKDNLRSLDRVLVEL